MAGLTKEQRETKKALESKAVEVVEKTEVVAPVVEMNHVEKNIAEAKDIKAKKKATIDDEDTVLVASYFGGRLQIKNPEKPYDEYVFEGFGEVQEIRFGTLQSLRRRIDGHEMFVKLAYVLDEDAVEQLGLKKFYADLPHPIDMPKLFSRPIEDIIKFIDMSNESTKQVLREILNDILEKKEEISYYVIKIVAEKLNYELNL